MVLYGSRYYGTVRARGGQFGATRFVHLCSLPILPISTRWVIDEGSLGGHGTRISVRSIAAAYLRTWGALAAVACLLGDAVPAAAALAAAVGWAWSWRFVLGKRARRASDLNQLAFKTRCEPRHMDRETLAHTRDELEERWAQLANGESPSDVARFGTDDPQRAAAAYGTLRLAALAMPPRERRAAEADAARIRDDLREVVAADPAHPYRGGASPRRRAARVEVEIVGSAANATYAPASLLAADLLAALAPHGYVPFELPPEIASILIERAWVFKTFSKNRAVVILRAPSQGDLGTLSRALLQDLALAIGYYAYRLPLSLQLVWIGDIALERTTELAASLDTIHTNRVMLDSISVVDTAGRWTTARTKAARALAEPIVTCLRQRRA